MSYLSIPRVHFVGSFGTSTPTGNNNNYDMVLDPENVGIFPPYDNMDDATFRTTMMSLEEKDFGGFLGIHKAEVLNANWNFYGDNNIVLTGVNVIAIDGANGRITSPSVDNLIGTPLQMFGDKFGDTDTPPIMVDNDPTSDLTSQIFASKVLIGKPGSMITASAKPGAPLPVACSRAIHIFYRNLVEIPDATFAAIWQHALPNANLVFDTSSGLSQTLLALRSLAAQGQGLQIRYCTYFFQRRFTDQEMATFFKQRDFKLNESAGIVVGTIGVWNSDELGTVPKARMLVPNAQWLPYPNIQPGYQLGITPAYVDTKRNVVVLDLISTFPEVTKNLGNDPRNLQKINLGVATLKVNVGNTASTVGSFPYDSTTYVNGGGIVEVAIPPNLQPAVQNGTLFIQCSGTSLSPVLSEYAAVAESDQHCVYVTEGQSVNVTIRAWTRGQDPTSPLPVTIEQFRSTQALNQNSDPEKVFPQKYRTLVNSSNPLPFVTITPNPVTVGPSGTATFQITGLRPGVGMLRLVPGTINPPDPQPDDMWSWMFLWYVNVRVLPADSQYDNVPDSQLTWDYIYDNVLRYYYRMYPTMDRHVLLNNQQAVAQAAAMIQMCCDQSNWYSTIYMPITRELSDGKRRLLQRWCSLQPKP